jgi:hypothetical protein
VHLEAQELDVVRVADAFELLEALDGQDRRVQDVVFYVFRTSTGGLLKAK